jgi:hypothetical protein
VATLFLKVVPWAAISILVIIIYSIYNL